MSENFLAEAEKLAAAALVSRIRGEIPLTRAMEIGVAYYTGHELALKVPLAPNINDKHTAFAGSITSLGCITGWCLLTLWAEREIGACQVAIYDAHFAFKKPLRGDFTATVMLPAPEVCKALQYAVTRKGKGKVTLKVVLADAGGVAAVLEGTYALWASLPPAGSGQA
ncbi:MAG: YiiD C-terminal domain-containing protein [Pseudomonadota bacterium]